jgi:hypothetical protein
MHGGKWRAPRSAVYDVVIIYLLTELHSGYDLPWSAQNVFPTVFAGSKRHTQHHLTGKGFYQVRSATRLPVSSTPTRTPCSIAKRRQDGPTPRGRTKRWTEG